MIQSSAVYGPYYVAVVETLLQMRTGAEGHVASIREFANPGVDSRSRPGRDSPEAMYIAVTVLNDVCDLGLKVYGFISAVTCGSNEMFTLIY